MIGAIRNGVCSVCAGQADRALADHPLEIGADVRAAGKVIVGMGEFGGIGEQRRGPVPLAEIDIERPGVLQPLDRPHAFRTVDIAG